MSHRILIALIPLLFSTATGCVTSRADRLARHDLSPLPSTTTSVVRETGVYQVKWVRDKASSGAIEGTERILRRGDTVGFTTTDAGELVATAGEESFAIEAPIPDGTRRLIWYGRHEEPSDLTVGTGNVLRGVATGAAVGALVVGAVALDAALGADEDDDDHDVPIYSLDVERQERREDAKRHRRLNRVNPMKK